MTTIVDRTDSPAAADRIRDDDFLADKKRVNNFFFYMRYSTTPLTYTHLYSSSLSNSVEPYRHLRLGDIPIHAPILATSLFPFHPRPLFLSPFLLYLTTSLFRPRPLLSLL
jgi:hypothetical protein